MKVVFFGTPAWAARSLRALAASGHALAGVVTAPDAPVGRSRTPSPSAVRQAAEELGVGPVLTPATLRDPAARAAILDLAPDVLAVVAYGRILPGRLLDAPRHGAVNLHFSLLPRHRGASPVQHTILCGDALCGVSTMAMDRGLDTGPVLAQWSDPLGARETSSALGERLAEVGARLLVETLDGLEAGRLPPRPQDDAHATLAPLLSRDDGFVHWSEPAVLIDRRVRAFDPWPAVVCRAPRGPMRLCAVEPRDGAAPDGADPGFVLGRAGAGVDVVAGEGSVLRLLTVQPAGGRAMDAAAALAGRHLCAGERLGDGGDGAAP